MESGSCQSAVRLLFLLLFRSLCIQSFTTPSYHHDRVPLQSFELHAEQGARAGADGYSLLRQPVNWDVDEDPVFSAPTSLSEEAENQLRQNADWWELKQQQQPKRSEQQQQQQQSQSHGNKDEQVDLLQRSLDTLDFPRVLRALAEDCTTIPARILVQEAAKTPKQKQQTRTTAAEGLIADSADGCRERYGAVRELQWILESSHGTDRAVYRDRLGYKQDIGGRSLPFQGKSSFPLKPLVETGDQVLQGEEIRLVSDMLDAFEDTQLWSVALEELEDFIYLPMIASAIDVNTTLQELLHGAFDKDGRLDGSMFPTIGRLRALVRSLKGSVLDTLNNLIPSLQSKLAVESGGPLYSEISGGRLVIPVDPKYASSVGIVHDRSRSGKTVYVEPHDILAPTNDLRQTESELQAEESRVWRYLTEQVLHNKDGLETSVAAIAQLDLVAARVQLGKKLDGVLPEVKDEGMIRLQNAKHPVLLLRQVPDVVGSDISLGDGINQGLVLTGPNAGGKTVILKLLGLVALMSRSGIPIPAETVSDDQPPRVDFFNPVLADIGDIQSVGGDLSTFSGHMLVCREVLENAAKNTLVLMDEISSGTDPNQGVAIAQALLEAMIESGAKVAITTHYMQLKQLAACDDRFAVAGMQFVNGRPTYRLQQGTVGESFALSVAERLGLPTSVIDRASSLLDSETRQMGELIRDMEDQKALVDREAAELQEKKKELAKANIALEETRMKLEKKQLEARRVEAKKFAKVLEEKESLLEGILQRLKSDPSRRVVAKSWADIKMVRREALEEAENVPSMIAQKAKAAADVERATKELVPLSEMKTKPTLEEGDRLIVRQKGSLFGKEATVVNSSRNRVNVRVGNLHVNLKLADVSLGLAEVPFQQHGVNPQPTGRSRRSKAVLRAMESESKTETNGSDRPSPTSTTGLTLRTDSNTVDVRGCNLMEAQEKIRAKLSSSFLSNQPVVYVLHGHGTGGVLKSKIRAWLKTTKSVKRFAPADQVDGGDAFTRVSLR